MSPDAEIGQQLERLKGVAPAGYAIALHVRFMTPTFLFQTYPKAWIDHYSQNGLVMQDPTVRWGFENTGMIRWSDLAAADTAGVLAQSAEHGMAYGLTIAIGPKDDLSMASFARSDREFNDGEVQDLQATTTLLASETDGAATLSAETQAVLRRMSVFFTHP